MEPKVADFVVEEPPKARTMYDWAALATLLRSLPMEWVKVFENDRASLVTAIKAGKMPEVHRGLGFEITTRNNKRTKPRTCTLYMRYNPDEAIGLRQTIAETRRKATE